MSKVDEPILKDLCAKALGDLIMTYYERISPADIFQKAESNALALIAEIKNILDDRTLSDPDCFQRIDMIVSAFCQTGLPTSRHWEAE